MKSYQYNKIKNLEKYKQFEDLNPQNIDLPKIIHNKNYLILFFNYLIDNKIKYEILHFLPNSILFLKLLTLNPKYLTIILNESDSKKFLVNYEDLNILQKKFLLNYEIKRNAYILFLDPSINSIRNVRKKSLYVNFRKIELREEYKRIINTNTKILIKKELRSGLPFGRYNKKNKLNDLTGKQWIKFTKSWFIHNPPHRTKVELLHPAKFPESLVERYIKFFTKERDFVLDPFIGTGATAIAAFNAIRSCIGFDINKKYINIAKFRLAQETLDKWVNFNKKPLKYEIIKEDSKNLKKIWKERKFPLADFCITSPPYWNQLKRNHIRQTKRKSNGLDTIYSNNIKDIGNVDDYEEFIKIQKEIFDNVYQVLKNKGYLVIITNNIFYKGRLYPLAFDTTISLLDKWVLKDEQIWCQDDKQLIALGINNAYVGNRHHVYCLIFRKEEV